MIKRITDPISTVFVTVVLVFVASWAMAKSAVPEDRTYDPGSLKAVDSATMLKVGDSAPDFTLPTVGGNKVSLSEFKGKKNVVISFVPAAWTPVCSQQWPGYNIAKEFFDKADAVVVGISVDNTPTLYAWIRDMGTLWFPVASDFWPHGAVAQKYGVLRSNGEAERSLFVVDKKGIIRYIDVHDINTMPRLEILIKELDKLEK